MSLIFVGDISYPYYGSIKLEPCDSLFAGKYAIGNLEGALEPVNLEIKDRQKYNLYSGNCLFSIARAFNLKAVSLANNHSEDFRDSLRRTTRLLGEKGIDWFGLIEKPFCEIEANGRKYVVFGVCSPLTGCKSSARVGIHTFEATQLLRDVELARRLYPTAVVVVYIHWGYELALFPQPADREWARAAIRVGASAVIGHHPHVVQGAEYYEGGLIAYSLGNWLLAQVRYYDKRLSYPRGDTDTQIAVELQPDENGLFTMIHTFRYDRTTRMVRFVGSSELSLCPNIKKITPYAGFSDSEYRQYFKNEAGSAGTPRRTCPTFWTYRRSGILYSRLKYATLSLRNTVRKIAILMGLHHPYG